MGWAEKLPSGKYRAVYRDAHVRKRSAGTHTHKAAATRAANAEEARARASAHRDLDAGKQTWSSWCDEWWASRDVASSTLRNDDSRRRNHLDPRWADVPLAAITRQDVKTWAADLRRGGVLGAESVKRCVHLLSASLNGAVDAELIPANPAARLQLRGGAPAQERFLTREEYDALWDSMPTTHDRLILEVLCYTGMRWGEMTGLHRRRVDLERGLVRVVETYEEAGPGGAVHPYPKGKQIRDVPLTASLVEQLGELETSKVKTCGVVHEQGRCVGPLMLPGPTGVPLRNSNWSERVWRPAVARSGVGHVRPHDCRHTYASWLLQDGVSLADVGKLMGHKSVQTTAKYAHLAESPTAAVLAALGNRGSAPRLPHGGPGSVVDPAAGR